MTSDQVNSIIGQRSAVWWMQTCCLGSVCLQRSSECVAQRWQEKQEARSVKRGFVLLSAVRKSGLERSVCWVWPRRLKRCRDGFSLTGLARSLSAACDAHVMCECYVGGEWAVFEGSGAKYTNMHGHLLGRHWSVLLLVSSVLLSLNRHHESSDVWLSVVALSSESQRQHPCLEDMLMSTAWRSVQHAQGIRL